ncbi:tetratricopeptide repeat protein [Porticoccus sp. W117]|uniref:tetratricopeptide repeat protein n=1 Tax=Porticoccus sp. W117 TaxID=3054777 RepID=UPI002591CD50|nr:tetratricopeptide repeat protein [Porticoccus sp. W117]MDM3870896.1 tetratricopeptide repeat protein [Porticoccus sp. W117]
MSLVNNMLRDLEDRQDTSGQPAGVSPALTQRSESASRGSKLSLTIGICLFASAATLLSWHNNWWQQPVAVEAIDTDPIAKVPAPQPAAQPVPVTPAAPIEVKPEAQSQPVVGVEPEPQVAIVDTPEDIVETESLAADPEPLVAAEPVVETKVETEQEPQPTTEIAASSATQQRQAVQEEARKLLAQGQLTAASERLEAIRPSIDQHPDHYALLAGIYHKQGQPQKAVELYGQLVEIERDNAIYWLGLAVALDAIQDRNALGAFQTTRQLNNNPDVAAYVERRISQLKNPG